MAAVLVVGGLTFALAPSAPSPVLARSGMQPPLTLPAAQSGGRLAHYIVFQRKANGALQPLSYRQVQLDEPLESLSEAQARSQLAQMSRQGEMIVVTLEGAKGGDVFRTIVDLPRWVRAEFHGDKPGDAIEGQAFPVDEAVFVVRVPAIAGTTLVVADERAAEPGRFDVAGLVAHTPQVALDALAAQVEDLRITGSSANRVDWLILGDGYTATQHAQFINDVQNLVATFFEISPYAEYANYINVRALFVPSAEAGADHPPYVAGCSQQDAGYSCCGDWSMQADPLNGTFVNTAFSSSYCRQNLHRLMGVDSSAVYAAAAAAPNYDQIMVLVNDKTYGGAGGTFSIVSMHEQSVQVAQHEYGHSFARLADEYESPYPGYWLCSDTSSGWPCEANVTDVFTRSQIKWLPWISPSTPIPTVPQWGAVYSRTVGLFEGARYQSAGLYRSGQNCIMRNLGAPFCRVPAQAYVLRLYQGGWGTPWDGIRLIEPGSAQPRASVICVTHPATLTLSAAILQPTGSPSVAISWLIDNAPVPGAVGAVFTYTTSAARQDLVRITLRVEDRTALVHPAMAGSALVSTHTWIVAQRQLFFPSIASLLSRP